MLPPLWRICFPLLRLRGTRRQSERHPRPPMRIDSDQELAVGEGRILT